MRAIGATWKSLVLSAVLVLVGAAAAQAGTTVAQWNMDELSGTTMSDSSENGNDGTIVNVTLGKSGDSGAEGDYAYSFDGSTSAVTVPSSTSLNPGASDITITVHIKTSVAPGTGTDDYDLLRKGGAYNIEIYPKIKFGSRAKCKFRGDLGRAVFAAGPDLIDGAWHTITCQKTASSVSLTVDGTTYTRSIAIGDIRSNKQPVAIGWQTTSTDYYNGRMDDVSIVIG
jgi:hypothetical protein